MGTAKATCPKCGKISTAVVPSHIESLADSKELKMMVFAFCPEDDTPENNAFLDSTLGQEKIAYKGIGLTTTFAAPKGAGICSESAPAMFCAGCRDHIHMTPAHPMYAEIPDGQVLIGLCPECSADPKKFEAFGELKKKSEGPIFGTVKH